MTTQIFVNLPVKNLLGADLHDPRNRQQGLIP